MPYLTNTFTALNLFEKLIRDAHMKVLNVCCRNVALFMIVKLRNKVSNKREMVKAMVHIYYGKL